MIINLAVINLCYKNEVGVFTGPVYSAEIGVQGPVRPFRFTPRICLFRCLI